MEALVKRLCALVAIIAALLLPATAAQASPSAGSTPSAAASSSDFPADDDTVTWGASVMRYGAEAYRDALARSERRLAPEVIRYFVRPHQKLSWPTVARTHPLVISFKLPPRGVLKGSHDAELRAFFAATPRPTYWSYFHEPEDNIAAGQFTAADYRAAWARIAAIAKASGKPLKATLVLMGYTAKSGAGRTWTDYYPGPKVIDVLAWDCYAWTPRDTPATVYGAALRVSQEAGKPWAIAETGVSATQYPRDADRRAKLRAMSEYLATAPTPPEFVTYFDNLDRGRRLEWNISRDHAAAAAWRAGQNVRRDDPSS
jgi:hypothetical protein